MKEYVCSVCGYVHKTDGELPEDFKCPLLLYNITSWALVP